VSMDLHKIGMRLFWTRMHWLRHERTLLTAGATCSRDLDGRLVLLSWLKDSGSGSDELPAEQATAPTCLPPHREWDGTPGHG
ncbi:MAG: hypothetical protein J2P37_30745, partial [Ktedonobacteraceae bacterium]|nr:hypothetical protein [Ktedonobacteraceae bacterium]